MTDKIKHVRSSMVAFFPFFSENRFKSAENNVSILNPCHAEYVYVLHSSPIYILLDCCIPIVSMLFQSGWKTVWILV